MFCSSPRRPKNGTRKFPGIETSTKGHSRRELFILLEVTNNQFLEFGSLNNSPFVGKVQGHVLRRNFGGAPFKRRRNFTKQSLHWDFPRSLNLVASDSIQHSCHSFDEDGSGQRLLLSHPPNLHEPSNRMAFTHQKQNVQKSPLQKPKS